MSPATASPRSKVASRFCTIPRSDKSPPDTSVKIQDTRQRADDVRTAQVRAALAECCYHGLRRVGVHVVGTLVRLTGKVGSYYQKQQATTVVLSLDGVERLENDLQVCR